MTPPRIGITFGDPGGIGPEIVLKSIFSGNLNTRNRYVIFGSEEIFDRCFAALKLNRTPPVECEYIHVSCQTSHLVEGASGEENGRVSFEAFNQAVNAARRGRLDAVVTAPVSKHSWNMAGIKWAGHTEFLNSLYPGIIMSFWSENLRVALFSHHIPLSEAVKRVNRVDLEQFIRRLHGFIGEVDSTPYTYLISGLNPHAGESGLLGCEEEDAITPAVEAVRTSGISIEGPYPPDIVFRKALAKHDRFVVALYHDQGLIPFKLDAFDSGVNATLGLPFVRTSPDHGTAFDIAGSSSANPESMIQAIKLADGFISSQA
ncbi:4-hydroxythreonine-4-phosphate dehydrogenase PdxA [Acidobacteriota bacterium]